MIHEKNHHYKLSINPHRVGVVLLERKDVKKSFFITLAEDYLQTGVGVNDFFQIDRPGGCNREFTMIGSIL